MCDWRYVFEHEEPEETWKCRFGSYRGAQGGVKVACAPLLWERCVIAKCKRSISPVFQMQVVHVFRAASYTHGVPCLDELQTKHKAGAIRAGATVGARCLKLFIRPSRRLTLSPLDSCNRSTRMGVASSCALVLGMFPPRSVA